MTSAALPAVALLLAVAAAGCSAKLSASAKIGDGSSGSSARNGGGATRPMKVIVVDGKKLIDYGGRTFEFEYGSAKLVGDETFDALLDVRDFLRENPGLMVEVEGHTDSRGPTKANDTLSKQRAKAIVDNLVNNGIEASRLRSVGRGEQDAELIEGECFNHKSPDDPIVVRECDDVWKRSRRAVLRVMEE
jgi:outer membrane protein OmpA-like peptidoglycan-associated protein